MPILAAEALLRENNPVTKCKPPAGAEPRPLIASDSKSNTVTRLCPAIMYIFSIVFLQDVEYDS